MLRLLDTSRDNTQFLRRLVSELGWIDVGRFGYPTANAAFFLAQHSYDLPLILAALPYVEKDSTPNRLGGDAYALLFDRSRLLLGERQRYATQAAYDFLGMPMAAPVEDPNKVAAWRNQAGLISLDAYLRLFGGGDTVRFSTACAPPP